MTTNVAVLMGGWSAEREVSLVSGAACVKALQDAGYDVTTIDVQRDVGALITRLYPRPDAVLNALHGRFGEDGCIQGLLDILGIPYTHSGVLASPLAMDKHQAKIMLKAAGVPVTDHVIVSRGEAGRQHVMPPPYVIKPIADGSSFGVFIVKGDSSHPPQEILREDWNSGEEVMVERYISGRELTCEDCNWFKKISNTNWRAQIIASPHNGRRRGQILNPLLEICYRFLPLTNLTTTSCGSTTTRTYSVI